MFIKSAQLKGVIKSKDQILIPKSHIHLCIMDNQGTVGVHYREVFTIERFKSLRNPSNGPDFGCSL